VIGTDYVRGLNLPLWGPDGRVTRDASLAGMPPREWRHARRGRQQQAILRVLERLELEGWNARFLGELSTVGPLLINDVSIQVS
jgi:hypothetical protein